MRFLLVIFILFQIFYFSTHFFAFKHYKLSSYDILRDLDYTYAISYTWGEEVDKNKITFYVIIMHHFKMKFTCILQKNMYMKCNIYNTELNYDYNLIYKFKWSRE